MIGGSSLANHHLAAQNIAGPADYFERALAIATDACRGPDATVRHISLGAAKYGAVHFSDCSLENLLFPALAHQELPDRWADVHFEIFAWDSAHSGIPMWSPPLAIGDYLARGE